MYSNMLINNFVYVYNHFWLNGNSQQIFITVYFIKKFFVEVVLMTLSNQAANVYLP